MTNLSLYLQIASGREQIPIKRKEEVVLHFTTQPPAPATREGHLLFQAIATIYFVSDIRNLKGKEGPPFKKKDAPSGGGYLSGPG